MPIYNEEMNIESVLMEWLDELRKAKILFTIFAINDGSNDKTLRILKKIAAKENEIEIIDKKNSGHGQSCIYGYKYAVENNWDWIFQIDSDGQCDPKYLNYFLAATENNNVIYGKRKNRKDGVKRTIISRFLTLVIYIVSKNYLQDANVPYRLMKKETLSPILSKVPSSFYLANILIGVLQNMYYKIHWIDIGFRKRGGGEASLKSFAFLKQGINLISQLRSVLRDIGV